MRYLNVALLCLVMVVAPVLAKPLTFTKAKKIMGRIYSDHRETFYCRCQYNKKMKVNFSSCGYVPRKNHRRASRVEWEHIVPAAAFGNSRACWRQKLCIKKNGKRYGGRRCCKKIDPVFNVMESDLRNIVPAVGEVNGDRNNFSFTNLGRKPTQYGRCDFVTDFKLKKVQPAPHTRGFIARTYLYMHNKYNIPISNKQIKIFSSWNAQYPETNWEKTRLIRIRYVTQS